MIEFQTRQLQAIKADQSRAIAAIIAAGAIATIGVRFYPQINRANVCVIDSTVGYKRSRSFDGLSHVDAVRTFAREAFGAGGTLKTIERTTDDDGSIEVTYHVFK